MNPEQFWTSQDGQILTVKNKDENSVALTLAFWPRNPAEFEVMKSLLAELKFTERSSLARIGIEMQVTRPLEVDGNRLVLCVDAFAFDMNFPNAGYWKKLMRSGIPVGRLFHAPAIHKLIGEHLERRANWGYHLWGLMTLMLWMKRWKIEVPDAAPRQCAAESEVFVAEPSLTWQPAQYSASVSESPFA